MLGDRGGVAESDAEPRCGGGGGEARLWACPERCRLQPPEGGLCGGGDAYRRYIANFDLSKQQCRIWEKLVSEE